MVNLDLYRVFYTVAKNGSLTKAAEELYISQPAVSQSVKQLENQLGVTLFNRTHRGMELSEEGGKRIIGKVERALRLLEEAENEVGGAVARRGAELCLSASDEVFRYILADKIAAFTKKFPAVRLKFLRLKDEKAREMLRGGKLDAVFGEQSYVCEEHIASFPSGVSLSKVYLGDKKQAERLEGALQCMKTPRGKKACDAHVAGRRRRRRGDRGGNGGNCERTCGGGRRRGAVAADLCGKRTCGRKVIRASRRSARKSGENAVRFNQSEIRKRKACFGIFIDCGHEPFLRGITAPRIRRAGAAEKIFNDYKENIWQNQIKDFVIFVS